MNKISEVIAAFSSSTAKPALHLSPAGYEAYINESKLFGYPYTPGKFRHPVNTKGVPLLLLAQINCADFSCSQHLLDNGRPWHGGLLPCRGILQFYVSPDLPAFGMNHNNLCDQSNFRVIYHPQNAMLIHRGVPCNTIPVRPQIALKASFVREPLSVNDYRFSGAFAQLYKQMTGNAICDIFDLPNTEGIQVYKAFAKAEHRIGGYPIFAQEDPRQSDEQYREHDFVLLQLVSKQEHGLKWWDNGTITFLIREKELRKRDFSNVLFSVDFY